MSGALPRPPKGKSGWPWTSEVAPSPGGDAWPGITVVTPSFNQVSYLEETLRSVLLQGYPRLQYRVRDGGSTDGSAELLQRYDDHLDNWTSGPDGGPAAAIASGWEGASGEILAYLNSDDVYLPGTFAAVAQTLGEHPEAVGVCGWQLMMDADGYVFRRKEVREMSRRSLLELHFVPQPSIFVRRDAVERAGGIDPAQRTIFDFELWLRMSRIGPFVVLPRVLSATRWHGATITVNQLPTIGRNLAALIDATIAGETGLERGEARRLRFRAHGLATLYHLEPGQRRARFLRHLLMALRWAPGWRSRARWLLKVARHASTGASVLARQIPPRRTPGSPSGDGVGLHLSQYPEVA